MSSSTLATASQIDKISAYYCLLFPNFAYYLQTLSVSIGRRPTVRSGSSATSSDLKELVDIDLGPLSQVSRLHARIDYDEDQELFVLVVLGRNGAWVDGVWYASGRKVPLGAR
jgi:forkhead box protein K